MALLGYPPPRGTLPVTSAFINGPPNHVCLAVQKSYQYGRAEKRGPPLVRSRESLELSAPGSTHHITLNMLADLAGIRKYYSELSANSCY